MLLSLCLAVMLNPAAALGEEKITLTVPYTVTVEQRGSEEPGAAKFWLCLVADTGEGPVSAGGELSVRCPNVWITNGVGDYHGDVILEGTLENFSNYPREGIFVRQWEGQVGDGWTCDPQVWYVKIVPVKAQDAVTSVEYAVYPTKYDSRSGKYIPDVKQKEMAFTYIYGNGTVAPAPDTTKLPKTGDSSSLTLWLALLAVSVAGAAVYGMRRRSAR